MTTAHLTVAAICFLDEHGRLLSVRKRGTSAFMLPGGKPEPGETAAETAVREVHEELGLRVPLASLEELGTWTASAANEAATVVTGTVFLAPLPGIPEPAAEIEELLWVPLSAVSTDARLAPLTREHAAPALLGRPGL